MSEETRSKVLRIMELALLINPTSTSRADTGDKPTVSLTFYGHCNCLWLEINPTGWYHPIDRRDREIYDIYELGGSPDSLDEIIERLEAVYQHIKDKGENNDDAL